MARTLYDKLWDEHVVHTEDDVFVPELVVERACHGLSFVGR